MSNFSALLMPLFIEEGILHIPIELSGIRKPWSMNEMMLWIYGCYIWIAKLVKRRLKDFFRTGKEQSSAAF